MQRTRVLPDTCAWIDFFRGKKTALSSAVENSLLHGELFTCGIVLFELLQGIRNSREESLVLNAMQALPHLDMTRELWISAGRLSSGLRAKGHNLPLSDIMVAAIALEHNCAVLTIDRHFEAVPGLKIIKGMT